MKRAAIYARYSSENQRDASIEDQIEVCRRYAAQLGLQVTATFQDRARSGASSNRPGYRDLLAQSRRGAFEVVIVEALDRLARKLSDVASLHDELQFHGMSLHAVNVGATRRGSSRFAQQALKRRSRFARRVLQASDTTKPPCIFARGLFVFGCGDR
ncbi:recombinase family protein, partial [Microvirga sp. 2YAF29]|uniref:recombinase family protein n=1 Tax=Microvirga sp. 2YAF29 TaxID=3233031 RepID=UPI003F9E38F5